MVISGLNCHLIGFAHIGTRLFHIGYSAYIFHLFDGVSNWSDRSITLLEGAAFDPLFVLLASKTERVAAP